MLSDAQDEFLNFLEQYWFQYGFIPSKERASDPDLAIDPKLYDECFLNAEFRKQCLDRGISLRGLEVVPENNSVTGWKEYMLTEEQLTVANVLLDLTDTRSSKKKLQDLGVPTARYQSWLRDPSFQNYIRSRAESTLGDNQHEAHLALVDRVRSGDMSAIKYFNEITGRYVATADRGNNVDVTMILIRTLEIIQRYVSDAAIQEAIATEFLQLSEPVQRTAPKVIQGTPVGADSTSVARQAPRSGTPGYFKEDV